MSKPQYFCKDWPGTVGPRVTVVKPQYVCNDCETVGPRVTVVKGNSVVELLLLCCFIVLIVPVFLLFLVLSILAGE